MVNVFSYVPVALKENNKKILILCIQASRSIVDICSSLL